MKAEYTGRYPGIIQITAGSMEIKIPDKSGACFAVDKIEISMEEARELLASLPQAIMDAEEARPVILPCPFDSGESRIVRSSEYGYYAVCKVCKARGPTFKTWQEAVENWNRRP